MSLKIIIGADLVPTDSNYNLFRSKNKNDLIGSDLEKILDNSDFSIFNLEVPLTDEEHPIEKSGPNLIAPTSTIGGIKEINPHFFTLANNHILDQGEQGLFSTIDLLDKHKIAYAGAGKNIEEARKPYIFDKKGKKIGIYCCAEHEFSIATNKKAGANLFDPFESLDDIKALKCKCDYVIVLYHGGKEYYRYPSPYLQKVCRKIVDKGADLVVCQHSHCIGCKEIWHNGTIVYGQGNFLFDHSQSKFWQTSLLIEISIEENTNLFTIDYIPLTKKENKVRKAKGEVGKQILLDFDKRTEEIKQEGFIDEKYKIFADYNFTSYLSSYAGLITSNFIYRLANKMSGYRLNKIFLKILYNKKALLAIQNHIVCEAHKELFITGLKNK